MEPRVQVPVCQRGVEGPGPAESGLPRASTEGWQGKASPGLPLDCPASVCRQDRSEAGHSWKNKSYSALNETRNHQDLLTGWMWRKEDASPTCPVGEQAATS